MGARNPSLTRRAVNVDRQIGLLSRRASLLYATTPWLAIATVIIDAVNMQVMVQVSDQPGLREVAHAAACQAAGYDRRPRSGCRRTMNLMSTQRETFCKSGDLDPRSSRRARVPGGGQTKRFTPSWCGVIAGVQVRASHSWPVTGTVRGNPLAEAHPSLNSQRHGEA
jgi:hypothetical protein